LGAIFQLVDMQLSEPTTNAEGRARLATQVTVSCPMGEAQHSGEVNLDNIASDVPWRHWKIVHSTFGGLLTEP
jgi:hypothetical protein